MASKLYGTNRMTQGNYSGNGNYSGGGTYNSRRIGFRGNGGGFRQGADFEQFKQALAGADDSFFQRMQEEARQRGLREEEIQTGMKMIQQIRQQGGSVGGSQRSFQFAKGGNYYG